MKKPKDSLYPPDWVKYARKDWSRIYRMLRDQDIEGAAFFLQQALEKYIKAFLLQSGWPLRKIHDLDALLDDVVRYNPSLEAFRSLCKRVSGYYFADKYPPLVPSELTFKDVEKDIQEAKNFIQMMFTDEKLNG